MTAKILRARCVVVGLVAAGGLLAPSTGLGQSLSSPSAGTRQADARPPSQGSGRRPTQSPQSQEAKRAKQAAAEDFQLALLRYPGGRWNPRPGGLARLAWEVRRRTSIEASLAVATVEPESQRLFDFPLVVWQGNTEFHRLSETALTGLRRHVRMGGTLLIDLTDGEPDGGFSLSVRRELKRMFPSLELRRVPHTHAVYKSFYLAERHGGRVAAQSYLEGLFVEGRLAVVLYANDMAGAMARDSFGRWEHDVGPGGDTTREMTFRLGVNIVMYALCLDYKEDQVHIPFILQRRR